MLKFGRQGAQVEQVDGSFDFSGLPSRCSRCSRCFGPRGAAAAAEQESLEQVNDRANMACLKGCWRFLGGTAVYFLFSTVRPLAAAVAANFQELGVRRILGAEWARASIFVWG